MIKVTLKFEIFIGRRHFQQTHLTWHFDILTTYYPWILMYLFICPFHISQWTGIKDTTKSFIPVHILIFYWTKTLNANRMLNLMKNGAMITFSLSTFLIYVGIFLNHLHILCLSQNPFDICKSFNSHVWRQHLTNYMVSLTI